MHAAIAVHDLSLSVITTDVESHLIEKYKELNKDSLIAEMYN